MAVERYRIVRDGVASHEELLWDGVSKYSPPGGGKLVKASAWNGPVRSPAIDVTDANRRTIDETLAQLVAALGQDRDRLAAGTATAAQKDAALLRCVRAVRLLARVQVAQLDGTD